MMRQSAMRPPPLAETAERPDVVGLAVPDMMPGPPGMDAGDEKEPYEVPPVRGDGSTVVFAS